MKISDTTFALGREIQTVLVNVKGDAEKAKALRWTNTPFAMAWDEPYAIGLLPESVEVLKIFFYAQNYKRSLLGSNN